MKNSAYKLTVAGAVLMFATSGFAETASKKSSQVLSSAWGKGDYQKPQETKQAPDEEKPHVFFNHGNIVLDEDGKVTRFITPSTLREHGRFQIKIKRPKKKVIPEQKQEAPVVTLSDRIEARRIMHDANQAYFKGEVAKTWELVAPTTSQRGAVK